MPPPLLAPRLARKVAGPVRAVEGDSRFLVEDAPKQVGADLETFLIDETR
ncbi:MAG TPA: hypothetical protein VK501_13320 [Baekduia sp.]|nr:hypothetical protein [Baekduia sp.]HMJ34886.1 hypothetical protein [Baekduia sp.]